MEYAHPLDIYYKYIVKNLMIGMYFFANKKAGKNPAFYRLST